MFDSNSKKIAGYHKHIDNGGLSIDLYDSEPQNYEYVNPWLTFSESFFGYATGSVTLHRQITPETLREMGIFFMNAATKLEDYHKKVWEKGKVSKQVIEFIKKDGGFSK